MPFVPGEHEHRQSNALANSIADLHCSIALPNAVAHEPLNGMREKLVKIRAKIGAHTRHITIETTSDVVRRELSQEVLQLIDALRRRPAPARKQHDRKRHDATRGVLEC